MHAHEGDLHPLSQSTMRSGPCSHCCGAGYNEEAAVPQAPPVALTTSVALRDCALRYEPPGHGGASGSLTDAAPVAAALLIGSLDTHISPAAPVCVLQRLPKKAPACCMLVQLPDEVQCIACVCAA